ncbi:prolow-density lipoprotein receptor-related protein 1 isoform X3 [Neodiprion lecontei]|uniref:Prolow-density lipoprotein receptor-related protein 1 isoform X3 n=1 Tax=Neodiprion lecontei TaxID=441921 RepID=A0ABM3G2Z0_NEOLC|nr:prolow-density lipoprotein receptor-related protein 1 isoform X3 [Neodiprion lecontei]
MMKNLPVCFLILVVLAIGIHGHPNGKVREQICTPGTQTKVDCNMCTCSEDGTALACTKMMCVETLREYLNANGLRKLLNQDNPLLRTKRDQVCQPNAVRIWDCNTCRCNPQGTAEACTRSICPKPQELPRVRRDLPNPLKCKPNEGFMDDCNHCWCSRDGRSAACTLMACPPNNLTRQRRETRCTPNERFMDDCNHCTCSPDGRSAICTLMACLPKDFKPPSLRT